MKITLLGTGTPAPSLERQSSGYVFEIGSDVIVMDHGPGAHQRLLEAGYAAEDVTHFFVSHYHYDHVMDYPRLLLTRWDHGPVDLKPMKVFGPNPLHTITERFIGETGAFALDIAARTESPASLAVFQARGGNGARPRPQPDLRELAPGDVVEGDGWKVTAGPASHVQPQLDCLAYRIETPETSVVYSGDNAGVHEPFIEFARGCDILIHMNHFLAGTELNSEYRRQTASHLDVAETARRVGAGRLVLTHILPQLDRLGVKERMVAEMAGIYNGTIIVGRDLMRIPLVATDPTIAD